MFWIGLIVGLVVGANISLILYACITSLSNKEGFWYASNKYLGGLMEANEDTISKIEKFKNKYGLK